MKQFLTLSLLAGAILPTCFAQTPSNLDKEREARKQTFRQLSRGVNYSRDDPGSGSTTDQKEVRKALSRMHELVLQETKTSLALPGLDEPTLVRNLKAVQSTDAPSDWVGNTPFAHFVTLMGTQHAAVAYEFFSGGDAIPHTEPYLEFFRQEAGNWIKTTEAPTTVDFAGCEYFVSSVEGGNPQEAWFLVWGRTIGDTGTRLKVRLYAYDGDAVRTVWARDGLTHGELSFSKNVITLEFDRKYHPLQENLNTNHVHEEFQVVPDGVQCITPQCD